MFPSPREQRRTARGELRREVRDLKKEREELRLRRLEENSVWNKACPMTHPERENYDAMTDVLIHVVRLSIPDYNGLLELSKRSGETIDDLAQAAANIGLMDTLPYGGGRERLLQAAQAARAAKQAPGPQPAEPRSRW